MTADQLITPAIMIGGAGSRLWPLSRANKPKQFLDLAGNGSMFQDTLQRFSAEGFRPAWLLANAETMGHVTRQLDECGLVAEGIVVEPAMRGTAAAVAAVTLTLSSDNPDALILVAPADHFIRDVATFRAAVAKAAPVAQDGLIVTFGITPTAPETGYGYIAGGNPVGVGEEMIGYRIGPNGFREKPDRATAAQYMAEGYFWNAGIFLFRASTMVEELRRHAPETFDAARRSIASARIRSVGGRMIVEPDVESFLTAPLELSIDVGVMEKTSHAAVVPCEAIGWSDVGSLSALWEIADRDEAGNAAEGDALLLETRNSYVHAGGGRKVVAAHLEDMLVVDTEDALIVLPKNKAQAVKGIVAQLKVAAAPELSYRRQSTYHWGQAHLDALAGDHATLSLQINAGSRITRHVCKADYETWLVTSGAVSLDLGDRLAMLVGGHSLTIGKGDVISVVAVNNEACLTIVTSSLAGESLETLFTPGAAPHTRQYTADLFAERREVSA